MSREIKILDQTIDPGKSTTIKMHIARLNTRSKIDVPIIVERAKKEGPCLLLMGGIHGDEINGIEIVRQIISRKINKPTCGTVICIPLLNVFGFLNQTREFPDGRDLNRVFPGSFKGSLASRFAFHVMKEVVPNVDYCIDYHTGGAQRFNFAQIRINSSDEESLKLASIFGTRFIILAKNREKSFRDTMIKLGKKVLLFEGGKSLNLNKTVTKIGTQGAMNIMHYLGMRDFSQEMEEVKSPIIIKSSKWIRARHSGMFRAYVRAGQKVKKGMELGSISDPFGDFERVFRNLKEGYILNRNQSPVVNQGDALLHIGFVD